MVLLRFFPAALVALLLLNGQHIYCENMDNWDYLTSRFIKEVHVPYPGVKPESVIFGNSFYGYYEQTDFQLQKGVLSFDMIPPGYKATIQVFVKNPKGVSKLADFDWASPDTSGFTNLLGNTMRGSFSRGYFLLGGNTKGLKPQSLDPMNLASLLDFFSFPKRKENPPRFFVYILNNFNEIVSIYFPFRSLPPDKPQPVEDIVLKNISVGKYALLAVVEKRKLYFDVLDYKGRSSYPAEIDCRELPACPHHDFVYMNNGKFITFGEEEKSFVLGGKSIKIRGDVIQLIDSEQHRGRVLWRLFRAYDPEHSLDWNWKDPRFTIDSTTKQFGHSNSIAPLSDKGFLLSVRNLNKIIALDSGFNKILWSAGLGEKNSYRPKKVSDIFIQQHSVSQTTDGEILLFDNNRVQSRISKLKLSEKDSSYTTEKSFSPTPPVYSKFHGSAVQLNNKNILGLFPRLGTPASPIKAYLIEFDYQTGKETGRLELHSKNLRHPTKVDGLASLLGETYIGEKVPIQNAASTFKNPF